MRHLGREYSHHQICQLTRVISTFFYFEGGSTSQLDAQFLRVLGLT